MINSNYKPKISSVYTYQDKKMEIKIMIAILIVVCVPAFSSSPPQISNLDDLQESKRDTTVCGSGGIAHPEKFGHAGGGGRGVAGGGSHSNGAGSQPYTKGSTIPLYTAGAAAGAAGAASDHHNNHKNHSGSGRNYNCGELVTLTFILLAWHILFYDYEM